MTLSPHVANLRAGQKMGDMKFIDSMIRDGLWDAFNGYHMGQTAENVAENAAVAFAVSFAPCAKLSSAAVKTSRYRKQWIALRRSSVSGPPPIFARSASTAAAGSTLSTAARPLAQPRLRRECVRDSGCACARRRPLG